jgi:hypothetical protein
LPGLGGLRLRCLATLGLLCRLLRPAKASFSLLLEPLLLLSLALLLFSSSSLAVFYLASGPLSLIFETHRQSMQAREQRGHVLHAGVRGVFYMIVS